ncbi:helix-turn-helix transcriptional regulator [Paenibacillus sp. FSL R7-0297]|uniref:helix-turn-helix domain-containing protein n=1 Tax=Paenibacillus sp. FSL R7-0297 TaxID=2921680 RepID=UPI0030F59311
MSDFLRMLGENIRQIRKANNMTQEALSEKSGLTYSYISDVERGTRNLSIETLEKIINALDIYPSAIFNFAQVNIDVGIEDKKMLIESIRATLFERSLEEIKFIHQMTKNLAKTVDSLK